MKNEEEVIICRCEEVSKEKIEAAVKEGATSLADVRRFTRAGMGFCQGRTCQLQVAKIIAAITGESPENIQLATQRPPCRPVKLDIIAVDFEESYRGVD